jgi:uncharacterized membrane protein YecN with MAPEG domain
MKGMSILRGRTDLPFARSSVIGSDMGLFILLVRAGQFIDADSVSPALGWCLGLYAGIKPIDSEEWRRIISSQYYCQTDTDITSSITCRIFRPKCYDLLEKINIMQIKALNMDFGQIHMPLYTALFAAAMMILQTVLMALVIARRGKSNVPIGTGGEDAIEKNVRAHGNLVENAHMFLIGLALIELITGGNMWVLVLGCVFLTARLSHAGIQC